MANNKNDNIPGNIIENHEYDGIEELDNPLPKWWLQIFWGSVIFAVGYFAYYQLMSGPNLRQELAADLEAHNELYASKTSEAAPSGEELNNLQATAGDLEKGKATFMKNCVACHAPDGGGGIGPNLTDQYWVHGDGSNKAIYDVISNGVLEKGMPAWLQLLGPDEVKGLTLFVSSLKGTTPAAPKEPQGEEVK